MGRGSLVPAFIEIPRALPRRKLRKVEPHKGKGHLKGNPPATGGRKGLGPEELLRLFYDLAHPGGPLRAKAQIHRPQGVELKVEIPCIPGHGGKKELQAAVAAHLVQAPGEGGADAGLHRLQADEEPLPIPAGPGAG